MLYTHTSIFCITCKEKRRNKEGKSDMPTHDQLHVDVAYVLIKQTTLVVMLLKQQLVGTAPKWTKICGGGHTQTH